MTSNNKCSFITQRKLLLYEEQYFIIEIKHFPFKPKLVRRESFCEFMVRGGIRLFVLLRDNLMRWLSSVSSPEMYTSIHFRLRNGPPYGIELTQACIVYV